MTDQDKTSFTIITIFDLFLPPPLAILFPPIPVPTPTHRHHTQIPSLNTGITEPAHWHRSWSSRLSSFLSSLQVLLVLDAGHQGPSRAIPPLNPTPSRLSSCCPSRSQVVHRLVNTCYSFATQDQDKCMFGFPFFSIHTRMGLRCEARASPVNGASRLQVACKVIHATLQPRHPLIRLYIYANRSVICPKIVTTLSTGSVMGRREEGQHLLATLLANCNLPFPQNSKGRKG